MVEAAIDFPEEEIDFLSESTVVQDLENLLQQLQDVQQAAKQGVLLQEGIHVVIAGKPNAGKSSLLNCLSGRDTAIVTEIPGTTRDTLREYIQIDGLPLHVVDTAGIREPADVVEQEGIRRAKTAIEQSDLVLLIVDATETKENIFDDIPQVFLELFKSRPIVILKNKIDLLNEKPEIKKIKGTVVIKLSIKQQQGIDLLENYLKEWAGFEGGEGAFIARRRHVDAITRCCDAIQAGLTQLDNQKAAELLAEDLRQAQQALSEVTGQFTTDDLLDKIFSSFCIGK